MPHWHIESAAMAACAKQGRKTWVPSLWKERERIEVVAACVCMTAP
jgi:hypothetical protein